MSRTTSTVHTLAQIALLYEFTAQQLEHVRLALNGKAAYMDDDDVVWYRMVDIARVCNDLAAKGLLPPCDIDPERVHFESLFTIIQVTRAFWLDCQERAYLEKQLEGKQTARPNFAGKTGIPWFKWYVIQEVLIRLGIVVYT